MQRRVSIDVLICTYERASLVPCLESIAQQTLPAWVTVNVLVADNAAMPHARRTVLQVLPSAKYLHAPHSNISVARNALLDASQADFVAFIDDDEVAPAKWLQELFHSLGKFDAVFGDVRAVYPDQAPDWVLENDFYSTSLCQEKRVLKTGHAGNVLIRWRGTAWQGERFDECLGKVGGEDTDYFYRLYKLGAKFRASSAAFVIEPVPAERLCISWLFSRKFRCGKSYANLRTRAASLLVLGAACKVTLSCFSTMCLFFSPAKRRFWFLRSIFHLGVLTQSLKNTVIPRRRSF